MRAGDFVFFDAPFLAFAHRGGAAYGPNVGRENTRHAFDQAVALGYRYLETDVHRTADGVLVAFHDDRLDRVADRPGLIADLTSAELAEVRIGDRDAIPTFAELLEAHPRARFNVDAKADGSVDLLARTIAEHEASERVCVSSFSPARLHRLRRLLPGVASAATSRGVLWNRLAPALTRLINTPAPALQLPTHHTVGGRRVRILTPGLIRAVHRAGKQVHVWTVDDRAEIERLCDLGVDGIFTDRPDTLKDVLTARGLWAGDEQAGAAR
ncbi:glycerophosphoryl diester phosphodiesterase [Friedmanniella endophytica]|uniref:Glycerophosphoryl diester phosphodiesterase n=1 Tax=Microlunatus kandeliicorticis TaxID=1759536 RepID=A0A7W3ITJ6_9ACTN|nr:glycerophosphodiester phosphodiesterase family protein [Microlunatus kandeliicorticis]MBA8794994.1 glycerophosphoryl diester phosphodiesterase [Microlunatus kandeliicorticis]